MAPRRRSRRGPAAAEEVDEGPNLAVDSIVAAWYPEGRGSYVRVFEDVIKSLPVLANRMHPQGVDLPNIYVERFENVSDAFEFSKANGANLEYQLAEHLHHRHRGYFDAEDFHPLDESLQIELEDTDVPLLQTGDDNRKMLIVVMTGKPAVQVVATTNHPVDYLIGKDVLFGLMDWRGDLTDGEKVALRALTVATESFKFDYNPWDLTLRGIGGNVTRLKGTVKIEDGGRYWISWHTTTVRYRRNLATPLLRLDPRHRAA